MTSRGARVSFVVPTRNSARTIESCLDSLRHQTHPDCEIIVVDNHSDDGTEAVARRLAHHLVVAGPERSAQRNRGLRLATGDFVAFIDSDMYLTSGVAEAAVRAISAQHVDGVVLPEQSCGEGFFASCRALEKRLYLGNPDVESARFFRTERVRGIGGYREDLRAGEDWDLADRFAADGGRLGRIDELIWHDDGRVSLREMFRKKQYYGQNFAHYLNTRESSGSRRLARPQFFADLKPFAREPILAAGLVVLKTVETTGLATGVVRSRRS